MSETTLLHVDIIGNHPHHGRRGTIPVVDGKVTMIKPLAFLPYMIRVEFPDGEAAFAEQKNLRQVTP
jgi:hypothetical protein